MSPLDRFEAVEALIVSSKVKDAESILKQLEPQITQLNQIETEIFVYRIASLLLRISKTELAGELLDLVPLPLREDPQYKVLNQYQKSLDSVRQRRCFFPMTVPVERWWSGPHLLPNASVDGKEVSQWYSGRVESTVLGEVSIHAGLVKDSSFSKSVRMNIPFGKFNEWVCGKEYAEDLEEGRFVELVVYGNDLNNPSIAIHPKVDVTVPLPAMAFDSLRYSRASNLVREIE